MFLQQASYTPSFGGLGLMANEIRDAKDGLGTLLSAISGLRVLDYPAESVNEFPVAVVLFESRDTLQTLAGSTFTGSIKVVLLVSSANTQQAYDTLDQFIGPSGHQQHRGGGGHR